VHAAVLNAFGERLALETLPDPAPGAGSVVVDMAAAGIPGYTAAIFSGARQYMLELPVAPGAGGIGRVRAVGPDATRLKVGDWVFCDPTVRSRDDPVSPDIILQGWTAVSAAGLALHRFYHHGSFAEQMLAPTENVTPIGEIAATDAGRWCALGQLLVPYGGLLAGDLRAGETLVLNGATGGFGSAGVAVALGMGAGTVVATGRNERALADLVRRFGPRVRPARMTGVEADDRRSITEIAGGPIDCVLDLLRREANASQVRAAAMTVRPGGRVILMGGVGRPGGGAGAIAGDFALPYPWLMRNDITVRGKYMYPRDAVARMVRLVRAGLIDLSQFDLTEFALDAANDAVTFAADHAGPLQLTVLRPDRSL
jgi:alcohol dehydrogenase